MMGNRMDEGVIYADGVGGGGGIRTHGSCYTPPVFKTGAIDHSATPPLRITFRCLIFSCPWDVGQPEDSKRVHDFVTQGTGSRLRNHPCHDRSRRHWRGIDALS